MTSYASQGSDSFAAVISTGIDGVMNVMKGQCQREGMRPPVWLQASVDMTLCKESGVSILRKRRDATIVCPCTCPQSYARMCLCTCP
jgi:hypothetical protein